MHSIKHCSGRNEAKSAVFFGEQLLGCSHRSGDTSAEFAFCNKQLSDLFIPSQGHLILPLTSWIWVASLFLFTFSVNVGAVVVLNQQKCLRKCIYGTRVTLVSCYHAQGLSTACSLAI